MTKKAIVAVSFGSSHISAINKGIEPVENRLREVFYEHDIYRAFTSGKIIDKLAEEEGLIVPDIHSCFDELYRKGYREVILQPLHIIAGHEYEKVVEALLNAQKNHPDTVYLLGKPLLFDGTDYPKVTEALEEWLHEELLPDRAIVFMGHGSSHLADESYAQLDKQFKVWSDRVYMASLEGDLSLRTVAEDLEERGIKHVILHPFMLVAGEHVCKDMADGECSWEKFLTDYGFKVEVRLVGLGSIPGIQDRYVSRVVAAMPQSTTEKY